MSTVRMKCYKSPIRNIHTTSISKRTVLLPYFFFFFFFFKKKKKNLPNRVKSLQICVVQVPPDTGKRLNIDAKLRAPEMFWVGPLALSMKEKKEEIHLIARMLPNDPNVHRMIDFNPFLMVQSLARHLSTAKN